MYQRILLAIDGSTTSDAALREAAKLAGDNVQLHVISVAEDPFLMFANPYGVQYDLKAMRIAVLEEGEAVLKKAQQQLGDLGIKAETHLIDLADTNSYSIPDAILSYADTFKAELIVLGTHGRQGLKRFFLGSVAEYVVRTSPKPVLLVRDTPTALPEGEQVDDWPITPYTDR